MFIFYGIVDMIAIYVRTAYCLHIVLQWLAYMEEDVCRKIQYNHQTIKKHRNERHPKTRELTNNLRANPSQFVYKQTKIIPGLTHTFWYKCLAQNKNTMCQEGSCASKAAARNQGWPICSKDES